MTRTLSVQTKTRQAENEEEGSYHSSKKHVHKETAMQGQETGNDTSDRRLKNRHITTFECPIAEKTCSSQEDRPEAETESISRYVFAERQGFISRTWKCYFVGTYPTVE